MKTCHAKHPKRPNSSDLGANATVIIYGDQSTTINMDHEDQTSTIENEHQADAKNNEEVGEDYELLKSWIEAYNDSNAETCLPVPIMERQLD